MSAHRQHYYPPPVPEHPTPIEQVSRYPAPARGAPMINRGFWTCVGLSWTLLVSAIFLTTGDKVTPVHQPHAEIFQPEPSELAGMDRVLLARIRVEAFRAGYAAATENCTVPFGLTSPLAPAP